MGKFVVIQRWLTRLPYIGLLVRAAARGRKNYDKDMAASITYYTFLSLFPLILGLAAVGGFFLKSADLQMRVNELIVEILPVSSEFVSRNIASLIRIRGTAGLTSVIVLLWSASKMVGALSRAINHALEMQRPFAFYFSTLRYFGLTILVAVIMILTMVLSPMVEVLADLELEFVGKRWNAVFNFVASSATGILFTGMLVALIYALLPYQRLPWRVLLPGVVTATLSIELGKSLFAFYIEFASNYSTVYGSLSSIIVLLIWLYFSARVILYGAEVISEMRLYD